MVEGLSEAQIVERLLRLEQQVREHAGLVPDERETGVDPRCCLWLAPGTESGSDR